MFVVLRHIDSLFMSEFAEHSRKHRNLWARKHFMFVHKRVINMHNTKVRIRKTTTHSLVVLTVEVWYSD